jgi:hypothetical protein
VRTGTCLGDALESFRRLLGRSGRIGRLLDPTGAQTENTAGDYGVERRPIEAAIRFERSPRVS